MNIGLNATCLNDRPSGARQRFLGIYGELIRRMPDVTFVIFEPQDCRVAAWFEGAPNVTARRTPLRSGDRVRNALVGLPYWRSALAREKLDLFECFNLPAIIAPGCPTLLTVHDIRKAYGGFWSPERFAYKAAMRHAVVKCQRIITVSETIKREITGLFPDAKVDVIYNGLNETTMRAFARSEEAPLWSEGDARRILAVGHLEPRKNYENLISGFALARNQGHDLRLTIIGRDSGSKASIENKIAKCDVGPYVEIRSDVDDDGIYEAYKACDIFAFVSSYEGFGIPLLEAMAAGKPMVLSDIPVFRELTEGKVAYCAPLDVSSISEAIVHVVASRTRAEEMVAYGDQRLRQFDYAVIVEQVVRLYNEVLPQADFILRR